MTLTEAAVKRVRVFNLLVFAAILVLFFNFKLSEVLTFTTQINWEGSATQGVTFAELHATDILAGEIPGKYLSRENRYPADVYQYAALGVLLFAIAGIVGLMFRGRRPVYIVIASLICLFICFLKVESLAHYYANTSLSSPNLMITEQTVMSATTRIIRSLIWLSFLFNMLHTPLIGWTSGRVSALGNTIASRMKRTPVKTPAAGE